MFYRNRYYRFHDTLLPNLFMTFCQVYDGRVPLVVENRKGVFSRYPKKQTGSWSESDRGGTRLCEKVYNLLVKGKVFLDRID